MRRCLGENVGVRLKRVVGLLLVTGLTVVLLITALPKLSLLPRRPYPTAATSPTLTASPDGSSDAATPRWGRLATFYVLTGRKDDHDMSSLLADVAGSCRSLPASNTTSPPCHSRSNVYVLYGGDDEAKAVQAAINITR